MTQTENPAVGPARVQQLLPASAPGSDGPGQDIHRDWELPHNATAARMARGYVHAALSDWALESATDDLALMVSELVANATEHGAAPVSLSLRRDAGPEGSATLTVEVTDGGTAALPGDCLPDDGRPPGHCPPADTGRGLAIVSALADRWGLAGGAAGTTAWSVLRSGS